MTPARPRSDDRPIRRLLRLLLTRLRTRLGAGRYRPETRYMRGGRDDGPPSRRASPPPASPKR